jgi:hypothetical protein
MTTVSKQIDSVQSKVQETFAHAQETATKRVQQLEAEAKKALEMLGDRAQSELKAFFATAQESTKNQWVKFGGELVKLGEKLQSIAQTPADAPKSDAEAKS